MNIKPGLVSITFRQLSPREIVDLVVSANLNAIEWGGDIHVPPGDAKAASEVRALTEDSGLSIAAYGSYYRAGADPRESIPFEAVLESAVALNAPIIRIWSGRIGSAESNVNDWKDISNDIRRVCGLAKQANVGIGLEFHGGTLTDTNESTIRMLTLVDAPNLKTLWQPSVQYDISNRQRGIGLLDPFISHLHVFQWRGSDRLPLSDGTTEWLEYLRIARENRKTDLLALIEFVKNDSPDQFLEDAKILREWISELPAPTAA